MERTAPEYYGIYGKEHSDFGGPIGEDADGKE